MADIERTQEGDPHGWNPLANYVMLHELHIEGHPFVTEESYLDFRVIQRPEALYDLIVVEGLIVFSNGIHLEVEKTGDVQKTNVQRVRMNVYRYNAWRPGKGNVLRYDNQHPGTEDIYHRHTFDLNTGEEISYTTMTRKEFPVMHQIFDELSTIKLPE